MADEPSRENESADRWYAKLWSICKRIELSTVLLVIVTVWLAIVTSSLNDATAKLATATNEAELMRTRERNSPPVVDSKILTGNALAITIFNSAPFPMQVQSMCVRTGADTTPPDGISDAMLLLIPQNHSGEVEPENCRGIEPQSGSAYRLVLMYRFKSQIDDDSMWSPPAQAIWQASNKNGRVSVQASGQQIQHNATSIQGGKPLVELATRSHD